MNPWRLLMFCSMSSFSMEDLPLPTSPKTATCMRCMEDMPKAASPRVWSSYRNPMMSRSAEPDPLHDVWQQRQGG